MAANQGMPLWASVMISFTNLTSAGQFAALSIIAAGGSMIEMALSQFIINLRYFLMSLSLTQKVDERMGTVKRMIISHGVTDEIFAVSTSRNEGVGFAYIQVTYMKAIAQIGAVQTSFFLSLNPIFTYLESLVFLQESFDFIHFISFLLLIFALIITKQEIRNKE